jgi:hypothetical protein
MPRLSVPLMVTSASGAVPPGISYFSVTAVNACDSSAPTLAQTVGVSQAGLWAQPRARR